MWRPLRVVLLAYLLVLLSAMFFEESLIVVPARHPEGEGQPRGLKFEDARFEAADGTLDAPDLEFRGRSSERLQ